MKKKPPTMRFKLDGSWWRVVIQRPPVKELCEGLCDYDSRTIYLHPEAIRKNAVGIVTHEVAHAVLQPIGEDHIRELERVVSVVTRWVGDKSGGQLSVGQHARS
jgi:hypothetical protein